MKIPLLNDEYVLKMIEVAESPVLVLLLEAGDSYNNRTYVLLRQAAETYQDRVIFVCAVADENPQLVCRFGSKHSPFPRAVLLVKQKMHANKCLIGAKARDVTDMLDAVCGGEGVA